MSEEDIRKALQRGNRNIFEALLERDMTAGELSDKLKISPRECSDGLDFLEGQNLITYDGEKWSATDKGKPVHKKYYE